jgi:hypothetical protein
MSDERIDQIESDVRHLTRMLADLMREVRRNANEIAELPAGISFGQHEGVRLSYAASV